MDEVRTATLDLKNRRNRPPTSTPVPFADVEDDQNVTPYSGGQVKTTHTRTYHLYTHTQVYLAKLFWWPGETAHT